jgi:hypothetical protein
LVHVHRLGYVSAPFGLVASLLLVLSVAVARLPQNFVAVWERDAPLQGDAATWAFRLLFLAASGQAIYGALRMLRVEGLERAFTRNGATRPSPERLLRSIARVAAALVALTILYALAAVGLTGERSFWWPFVILAMVQGAWYLRAMGPIITWAFATAFDHEPSWRPGRPPRGEPPDFCPPLARGFE